MPVIAPKPDLSDNHALDTDSYKYSHGTLYPPGTNFMHGYLESRGGRFPMSTLATLQYALHRYLVKPFLAEHLEEAREMIPKHGLPFFEEGWKRVRDLHKGKLPIRIRAIPEGLQVPTGNILMSITSTDPEFPSLESFLETPMVRLWEGSTIATTSRESKKVLKFYLDETADNPDAEILFKLHDFGSRGVTCKEQARIAGAAHLMNFMGTDTIEGLRMANHYYDCDMAGFSIPATEHSTVTSWGREREFEFVAMFVRKYLVEREVPEGAPKLAACVADTYDVFNFVDQVTKDGLKDLIKSSGGTFIIRPDSGDPLEVLPKLFEIVEKNLGYEVYVNKKGYRVLPDWLRFIQGDGINIDSMTEILKKLTRLKWSASNIAFGSGGGLLQKWDRDTQKWAFKLSALRSDFGWADVRKDPITDPGKRSKAGVLDLIQHEDGTFETVQLEPGEVAHPKSVMNTVFENGDILYHTTLDECRERMAL